MEGSPCYARCIVTNRYRRRLPAVGARRVARGERVGCTIARVQCLALPGRWRSCLNRRRPGPRSTARLSVGRPVTLEAEDSRRAPWESRAGDVALAGPADPAAARAKGATAISGAVMRPAPAGPASPCPAAPSRRSPFRRTSIAARYGFV